MAPSGEQYSIAFGEYAAVITESGGALRSMTHGGRAILDGFGEGEMASGGRGQLLMPWPNRIRDGKYAFEGRDRQLPLTEPARQNASHGLVRWVAWSLVDRADDAVTLGYRLMAQSGYPWTLDLTVRYALSASGLTVTQTATNRADSPAPYAQGAHPYLAAGPGPVDGWELTLPAATRMTADPDRKLPTGREPVESTAYDLRHGRPLGDLVLDHAFTDLTREPDGRAYVVLRDPAADRTVALWVDEHHPWVMVYTGDDQSPDAARRALAVEPMTAPADAFNSGADLVVLSPAGHPGDTFSASWGITRVGVTAGQ